MEILSGVHAARQYGDNFMICRNVSLLLRPGRNGKRHVPGRIRKTQRPSDANDRYRGPPHRSADAMLAALPGTSDPGADLPVDCGHRARRVRCPAAGRAGRGTCLFRCVPGADLGRVAGPFRSWRLLTEVRKHKLFPAFLSSSSLSASQAPARFVIDQSVCRFAFTPRVNPVKCVTLCNA